MSKQPVYQLSVEEVLTLFSSSKKGLSSNEVSARHQEYGFNIIEQTGGISAWHILFSQFHSILVLLLVVAAGFSWFINERIDAVIILMIVVLNAVIGFVQEFKAEQTMASIKKQQTSHAVVFRDGKKIEVAVREIVPGDILELAEGQRIPADARLIEQTDLQVDESILTGESKVVSKKVIAISGKAAVGDRTNCLFSGTTIVRGSGRAVVFATASATEFGKIADLVQQKERSLTPLQRTLNDLGQKLGLLSVVISLPALAYGLFRGGELHEIVLTAIALAVSTIPEGLPIVVTIALAMGIRRMAKRNVLVRRLSAVEALGSINVICSDKTGTITENKMKVTSVISERTKQLYKTMVFASTATDTVGDPTEKALIEYAESQGVSSDSREAATKIGEVPFNSEQKFMAIAYKLGAEKVAFVKGAPEKVIAFTNVSAAQKKKILDTTEDLSNQGNRVLAFAIKETKGEINLKKKLSGYTFVGLVAMQDPPRKEVTAAIETCKQAGVRTIMITGDHPGTARNIAKQVGIEYKKLITGDDLDAMKQGELAGLIDTTSVFARVSPEHKMLILQTLQDKKYFVAMTGDGVNDAPALRQSDIGVAVEASADLAKDAADLILLDNNFASIVAAIEEGRGIFYNIKKFISFLLSVNFDEIVIIMLSLFMGLPLPLLPIHLLWLNVVTDSFPALALANDPYPDDLLKNPPYNPTKEILRGIMSVAVISAFLASTAAMSTFLLELFVFSKDLATAQTMTFTVTVLYELALVFAVRSSKRLKDSKPFENRYLVAAVALAVGLQLFVVYVPQVQMFFSTVTLGWGKWIIMLPLISIGVLGFEADKILGFWKLGKGKK